MLEKRVEEARTRISWQQHAERARLCGVGGSAAVGSAAVAPLP